MKNNKYYLFTLIELLMVIAIISILMSILLPALFTAKERIYQTVCAGNLRQIGMGVTQYTNDNNSFAPMQNYFGAADIYQTWQKWNRLSYAKTNYPVANMLIQDNYLTAKVMECAAAQSSRDRIAIDAYCILDTGNYLKTPADGYSIVYSTYLIKSSTIDTPVTSLAQHPELWGYRLKNPRSTLASDISIGNKNLFTHKHGINALFEDGAVSWLRNVPVLAATYYAGYPLNNGDARFSFFQKIQRGGMWNNK